MKQIIIILLVVIAGILGYGQYKQYERFTFAEYEYKTNDNIDLNYHNKTLLYNYYEAVEGLNNYIIMQWRSNDIDVRSPENEDLTTIEATNTYVSKLAKVKFYEDQLVKSATLKSKGLSNLEIKLLEESGISLEAQQKEKSNAKLIAMFHNNSSKLRIGAKSAFVFELQKLLVKNGYDIPVDGLYKSATTNALKDFETKNNLFVDGQLDMITLETLLK